MSSETANVSLVVTVRNEATSLESLITSICGQTRQPDEVLVVDGGSSDGTPALFRRLTHDDPRFVLLEAGPVTIGAGRNAGIEAARNAWVALTDAGVTLAPKWLETLCQVADADSGVEVVYGTYEPVLSTFFERCAGLAYVPPKRDVGSGLARGPSVASCLIRKDAWRTIGGFEDYSGAEDILFLAAVDQHGLRISWAPEATVSWTIQPSLRSTVRRFATYSKVTALAGLEDNWHRGVARQYLTAAPFVGLGLAHRRAWLAVPAAGAVARAVKAIWQKRDGRSVVWALNPVQLATVVVISGAIDLAMFVGWADAVRQRNLRRATSTEGLCTSSA